MHDPGMRGRRLLAAAVCTAAATFVLAACGLPLPGPAQPNRVPRVGYFTLASAPSPGQLEPFVQGLRELAYVEGKNIIVDRRYAAGNQDQLLNLASELATLKADVLVADGELPAIAAKRATSTIPVVFSQSVDPVAAGLVDSLARPGGNLTGLTSGRAQTVSKYLEFLQELLPGVSQVGVLWSPDYPTMVAELKSIETAALMLGIHIQRIEVGGAGDFDRAFQAATASKLPALIITSSQLTAGAERLPELMVKYRLPVVGSGAGIIVYGANLAELRRRAASYVDRILKGAKPADLPVQEPTKFSLTVNLNAAQAIGIKVPPALLSQASDVIQEPEESY